MKNIKNIVDDLTSMALSLPTCKGSSFGDILLYNNKSDVEYPYVNIDILNNQVINGSTKIYNFRIYIMDRNEPYIAYNKCELLLNLLMNQYDITKFTVNYFTLNYKDMINGVYSDIQYEVIMNNNECI